MKSYIKTLALITVIIFGLGSCEGFIEEEPYSFISPANFYETSADAEIALNGVYRTLNSIWSEPYMFCANLGVDELAYNKVKPVNTPHAANTYSPSVGFHTDLWPILYQGINAANYIIDLVPDIEMDNIRKTEIIAEAKYLRAFYYSHLAWMFGGVPLETKSQVELGNPRASLEDVYSLIFEDLTEAYETLPEQALQSGKATKYAAAGLLARNSLYLASCKENGVSLNLASSYSHPEYISFDWVDATQMYTDANSYLKDIYDNSGYSMIDNYNHLFYSETESEARAEMVFDIQFEVFESDPVYLSIVKCFYPKGKRKQGGGLFWNTICSEMYQRYDFDIDKRATRNIVGQLDLRDEVAYYLDGKKYYPTKKWNNKTSSCGKWRRSTYDSRPEMPDWAADINMPFLRFADVVLMYAETSYKLGDEGMARNLVTEVRTRAAADGSTAEDLNEAYLKADFMDELLDERSRELCFEGWRRWDLIRTGRINETIAALDPGFKKYNKFQDMIEHTKNNWAPYRIWFPIPLREVDLNKQLVQNPEY